MLKVRKITNVENEIAYTDSTSLFYRKLCIKFCHRSIISINLNQVNSKSERRHCTVSLLSPNMRALFLLYKRQRLNRERIMTRQFENHLVHLCGRTYIEKLTKRNDRDFLTKCHLFVLKNRKHRIWPESEFGVISCLVAISIYSENRC